LNKGGTMIVLVMQVHVIAEKREAFIELMKDVAMCSERDEPGCLRFDFLQDTVDPNKFIFYDVYRDEASKAAHRETAHYARYVEATKEVFDEPTLVSWTTNVSPTDEDWR